MSTTEKSSTAKAAKVAKPKKTEVKSSHPATSVMVKAAIESLKERKGSSLIAIKKYLATNYKVDPVKHSHFIRKALVKGVSDKIILQVKGVGATGSFKLAKVEAKPKKVVKPSTKKPKTPTKKKVAKSKPAAAKKATPKKKAEKSKSTKSAAKPKKPVAKKTKPSKAPAKKAAPKKK